MRASALLFSFSLSVWLFPTPGATVAKLTTAPPKTSPPTPRALSYCHLHDLDQLFPFDITLYNCPYRFEF